MKNHREKDKKDIPDLNCDSPFEPTVIHKMLNGIRPDLFQVEGRQEDAEEFLGCVLNGLNDEMLEVSTVFYFIMYHFIIYLVNTSHMYYIYNGYKVVMVHIIFCIKYNCSLMEHGGKNNCFEMVISLVFHCNEILQKNIHCFLTKQHIILCFHSKSN